MYKSSAYLRLGLKVLLGVLFVDDSMDLDKIGHIFLSHYIYCFSRAVNSGKEPNLSLAATDAMMEAMMEAMIGNKGFIYESM